MHHALQLAQYTNNAKVVVITNQTVENDETGGNDNDNTLSGGDMPKRKVKKRNKTFELKNDSSLTADIHGGLADKYSLLLSNKLEQSFNIMSSAIASRVFSASSRKNNGNIQVILKTCSTSSDGVKISLHRWTWCEDEEEEKIPLNRVITDEVDGVNNVNNENDENNDQTAAAAEPEEVEEEDDEEYEAEGTGSELNNIMLPMGLGEKDYNYFYGNHEDWLAGAPHHDSESESEEEEDEDGEGGVNGDGIKEKDHSYRTRSEKAKDGPFGGGKTSPFLVDYDNQLLYWMMEGVPLYGQIETTDDAAFTQVNKGVYGDCKHVYMQGCYYCVQGVFVGVDCFSFYYYISCSCFIF